MEYQELLIEVGVLVLLALIFWQDYRHRAIHIALPIGIFVLGAYQFYLRGYEVKMAGYSLLFLLLTLGGGYLYIRIRNTAATDLLEMIGLGDILFLAAVIPFFSPSNFILFFISGLLFSIVVFTAIPTLRKTALVPLAGLLALYMLGIRVFQICWESDVFYAKLSVL
ncbi:hypothetical protein HN014_04515 [Aquimarina sp. TRL1]|uniref:hypothetical protein n=1 Tax=Aquimarina sp. (strain TRL1) TaxID=2736252 RepID=UPI00158ED70F|nr:hypothetical protein [Aquimarina sp. TRL1]QKX04201.1 hypothetical protein HN014_04515 [Aquimarina sp. TRL1]